MLTEINTHVDAHELTFLLLSIAIGGSSFPGRGGGMFSMRISMHIA